MKELKELIDVCQKINRDCHISGKITAQGHTEMILATGAAKTALERAKVFEGTAVVGNSRAKLLHGSFVQFCMDEIKPGQSVTIIVIPREE